MTFGGYVVYIGNIVARVASFAPERSDVAIDATRLMLQVHVHSFLLTHLCLKAESNLPLLSCHSN